ncbi:MAG: hypothetical protein U0T84_13480 [Chitinophagales bacterium]
MRHCLLLIFCLLAVFGHAEDFSKKDKKKVLNELKKYKKNPQAYQRMINEYKSTIDSDQVAIKNWRDEALSAATKQVELEQKMAKMAGELEACQSKPVPECPKVGVVPATGTIYKVQLGLFDKFNINNYFTEVKVITPEEVEGMNRYVVSYFPDEETAKSFANDLRKLGLKDAFTAKYVDGQRVYEWDKNDKMKGKRPPSSIRDMVNEKPKAKTTARKQNSEAVSNYSAKKNWEKPAPAAKKAAAAPATKRTVR